MTLRTATVVPLDRGRAEQMAPALAACDDAVRAELGSSYSHRPWNAAAFLLDRPAKWRLSRVAVDEAGGVVGFWIASRVGSDAHTHRVAVTAAARGSGLGRSMFDEVAAAARRLQCERVTLTIAAGNARARRFYERLGFRQLDGARLERFLAERGHPGRAVLDTIEEPDDGAVYTYVAMAHDLEVR